MTVLTAVAAIKVLVWGIACVDLLCIDAIEVLLAVVGLANVDIIVAEIVVVTDIGITMLVSVVTGTSIEALAAGIIG